MDIAFYLKHPLIFRSQDYIKDICKPFLNYFDLQYFNYMKLYKDNTLILLTTNIKNLKQIIKTQDKGLDCCNLSKAVAHDIFLWNIRSESCFAKLIPKIKTRNFYGFTLVENDTNAKELYCFSTNLKDNKLKELIPNNISELYAFKDYFKDQTHDLISKVEDNKILCDSISNYF